MFEKKKVTKITVIEPDGKEMFYEGEAALVMVYTPKTKKGDIQSAILGTGDGIMKIINAVEGNLGTIKEKISKDMYTLAMEKVEKVSH